ncbi:MAG: hormogonium polysaccharide biosynthesis protein HpsA [Cyanobacteria bacterium P01_D01_bin.116]
MSKKRKLVRAIKKSYRKFIRKSSSTVKKQSSWLLRNFIVTKKRRTSVNSGFVLPTVAMVSLVVVLLTIAILFRSFERSKNASNVRVNQAVLNAAMPAIDRAKAKIDKLFTDPTLPRSTPADNSLYNAFTKNLSKYTFGDETPLEVKYDIDGNGTITNDSNAPLESREVKNTAWRFPVDTDNNGKYDSFTLYGVYFRSPTRGSDGKFNRPRSPLDARTPPMDDGSLGGLCAGSTGTSASLIGDSGWYKSGANIKKSFFVYSTTVPITDEDFVDGDKYETFKGNKGFSALEYQQDKVRVPIINNAVVYEDDLEITPGSGLKLNGRIFTNSNLLTGRSNSGNGREIILYQVSSPQSCFYNAENSKIIVGGNVGYGRISGGGTEGGTDVHLYKPSAEGGAELINNSTRTVNTSAGNIAFNSQAYTQRIDQLVEAQIANNSDTDPTEVRVNVISRRAENPGLDEEQVRREELEVYFKKRTRKVPFAEIDFGVDPGTASLEGEGTDALRAQDEWIYPLDPTNNNSFGNYANLNVFLDRLEATEPNMLKSNFKDEEQHLGDRIAVGNNLPALWFDTNVNDFVGGKTPQKIQPQTEWTTAPDDESKYRYRTTQIQELLSLDGASKRDGFFEIKASEAPQNPLDNVGGMRVVTGAGIYVDGTEYPRADNSFLPAPEWDKNFVDPTNTATNKVRVTDLEFNSEDPIIVWPDSMPMTGKDGAGVTRKGDLVMRATAVYHYTQSSGTDQAPIACVSSYHDPTNAETAQNKSTLPQVPDSIGAKTGGGVSGSSNNGIVYRAPYSDNSGRTTALGSYNTELTLQARLVFPNGRFVNEPLRKALLNTTGTRTMAENSAIDTAICAIEIENGTLARDSSLIPDGAIYEASFLDSREVKAIETAPNLDGVTPNYTLDIEQRQPLEVRVTVLDLEKLRITEIDGGLRQEYLIPNSGIIYATRDDALEDLSHFSDNIDNRKLLSPTDYKLDSTRRPNGIMLINGKHIHRDLSFRDEEKGLILATNVPAYIKGDLNIHAKDGNESQPVEEFVQADKLEAKWGNFYDRDTLDKDFACRKNDPRLPECTLGDSWRPATVVADAVTVLSSNYRFGFRQEGDYDLRNNAGNIFVPNYDFDDNGSTSDSLNETTLGIDLNGDGDITDTSVSESTQISVSAVRRKLGFFDNNYLTSAPWFSTDSDAEERGYPKDFDPSTPYNPSDQNTHQGSSYVNNFITPIQRRVRFGEYVMEMCRKERVETCGPNDWVVKTDGTKASEISIGTDVDDLDSGTTAVRTTTAGGITTIVGGLAKNEEDRHYPRRVAFLRDPSNNKLILDSNGAPVPIGIDTSDKVQYFPYNSLQLPFNTTTNKFDPASTTVPNTKTFDPFNRSNQNKRPRLQDNALWFQTTGDSSFSNSKSTNENYGKARQLFILNDLTKEADDPLNPLKGNYKQGGLEQPILVPVLQLHMPADEWTTSDRNPHDPGDSRTRLPTTHRNRGIAIERNWIQRAIDTTTNLVIAQGDTPPRKTESNGGLENFVRYLETWRKARSSTDYSKFNHNLSGSLIQYKRSAYATAPWQMIQESGSNALNGSIFDFRPYYRTDSTPGNGSEEGEGMSPFYTPPERQWGFDIALLSQIPDLFAQTFTSPTASKPNEFFREVSRDDKWVKTLLCAKTVEIDADGNISSTNSENAIPEDQRPSGDFCPT